MKTMLSLTTILLTVSACSYDRPTACEIKCEQQRTIADGLYEISTQKCEDATMPKLPADDTSCAKFCGKSYKAELAAAQAAEAEKIKEEASCPVNDGAAEKT